MILEDRFGKCPVCVVGLLVVAFWPMTGCQPTWRDDPPSVQARLADRPTANSDVSPGQAASSARPQVSAGTPIATVDSGDIEYRSFVDGLLRAHGVPFLRRWMMRDLARNDARRLGIAVSRSDVEAEYDRTIRAGIAGASSAAGWTTAQRERFVGELIRLRGWSRIELDMVMERQACLRKIAESRVTIDEPMLRQEFARRHGEKVEVRHIQLAALRFWPQLEQRLRQGESFEELATTYNQNPASRGNRGLLPPFTRQDSDLPGALREAAFALTPGQVSKPIQYEGRYHVLKLERLIPAASVSFEDAVDDLEHSLLDRLAARQMDGLSKRMLSQCRLAIHDQVLRDEYSRRLADGSIEGPAPAKR